MSKPLTWLKPSGEWGIEGVDLTTLPPKVYGALAKLMRLEHPYCLSRGDHLRTMSDEDLALWLVNEVLVPAVCPLLGLSARLCKQASDSRTVQVCAEWLRTPAKDVSDLGTFSASTLCDGGCHEDLSDR